MYCVYFSTSPIQQGYTQCHLLRGTSSASQGITGNSKPRLAKQLEEECTLLLEDFDSRVHAAQHQLSKRCIACHWRMRSSTCLSSPSLRGSEQLSTQARVAPCGIRCRHVERY